MKIGLTMVVAAALLAVSAVASAQGAGPRGGGGQQGAGRMQEMQKLQQKILGELNLNATQKEGVKKLDATRAAKLKKLRESAGQGGDREKMRAEMQKIQTEYRTGLKKVLGDAKFAQYEKRMKEEMEKLRKQRGQAGATGGRRGGGSTGGGSR
jgi:hypothetical protein